MGKERREVVSTRTACSVFLLLSVLLVVLLVCLLTLPKPVTIISGGNSKCPDKMSVDSFKSFPEGLRDVVLGGGKTFLLDKSIDVNTIKITEGATLVVADTGNPIKIRTKYIMIMNSGSLIIGSESCPYMSPLDIALYGRSDDKDFDQTMGRKFIGVAASGSLDIHGPWRLSWTYLNSTLFPESGDVVINLSDNASSWGPGDELVIASSSYDMNQAERFTVIECSSCSNYQVKIKGPVRYKHNGDISKEGVNVRAEVGLLTRNIKIHGEMESSCYLDNSCKYFDQDTFGGQTQVVANSMNARFEGIELYHMGQQVLGRYPIHFHRVGYAYGRYARQLSIHDCFSRCVTIHASQGVVIEDVVGYNTLGHCFFLEDGNEVDNTFRHNLGLVIAPGTLLPTDRNDEMCKGLATNTYSYIPNAEKECNAISTFWISHPNNTFENNAAAGSKQVGYYFAFYREPTSLSVDTLPPFHGERSPLGKFTGNSAHSNAKAGFFMNHGVKITHPSESDPGEYLSITELARYAPHVNRNLSLPRVPAIIQSFTGYKNYLGLWARGGDVWIDGARLADNDINVILASSSSLPYDSGSHQKLKNSVVVGRSAENDEWLNRSGSNVGIQIQDGPIYVGENKFYSFVPTSQRNSYAIGFLPNNPGVSSPANIIVNNEFDEKSVKISLGQAQAGAEQDGDITQNLYDAAGSLTGVPGSYVIRADNPLLMTSRCQNTTDIPAVTFCPSTHYGLLFINSSNPNLTMRIQDISSGESWRRLTLSGLRDSRESSYAQFQPVVLPSSRYRITWIGIAAPSLIDISAYHFNRGDTVDLEICYPPNTTFNVTTRTWDQSLDKVLKVEQVRQADDLKQLEEGLTNSSSDTTNNPVSSGNQLYYWNPNSRLLRLKIVIEWQTANFSYCPTEGCHYTTISANLGSQPYTECNSP